MKAPNARRPRLLCLGVSRTAASRACAVLLPRAAAGPRALAFGLGLAASAAIAACYSAGNGSAPPTNGLYYPVGLAVSSPAGGQAGDYLYVANSDFDLQYNGGTLQSYDLRQLRNDTASLIAWNLHGTPWPTAPDAALGGKPPFVFDPTVPGQPMTSACNALVEGTDDAGLQNPLMRDNGQRTPLGETCSPPVDSTKDRYIRQSEIIGAFATDLQLAPDGLRLYAPVRGNATLTYATVDGPKITCGPQGSDRCADDHLIGNNANAPGNTRHLTMPGEPFGMAQSQDGTAIAVTQQATQETSLLLSGYDMPSTVGGVSATVPVPVAMATEPPSMQFVLENVPVGGNGIVAVPHDRDAVTRCEDNGDAFPCVRQAFLETSRSSSVISLLRYYTDEGLAVAANPSLRRPFIEQEAPFAVTVNLPGTDQRGIVIDDTPRLKCKAEAALTTGAKALGPGSNLSDPNPFRDCGQLPARVFIGSRSPPSVIYGEIGGLSLGSDGTVDPDQLRLKSSVPVGDQQGVSRLYLAPVVDSKGHYALKLFVVLFDASTVWVFDPETIANQRQSATPEVVLTTGAGPFAMAFDPFCTGLVDTSGNRLPTPLDPSSAMTKDDCRRYGPLSDVAVSEVAEMLIEQGRLPPAQAYLVPPDPPPPPGHTAGVSLGLRSYRFGYLATFTNSYIQVLDLDDALLLPHGAPATLPMPTQDTFESIVFTLGKPTPPLGT